MLNDLESPPPPNLSRELVGMKRDVAAIFALHVEGFFFEEEGLVLKTAILWSSFLHVQPYILSF